MRMLLRVSIPVEAGNAAAKAGTLGSTVEKIVADLKPEAAYFFNDDNGNRSGSIVFDLKDFVGNPGDRRAVVSRVQRKGLFSACHEPARPSQGWSVDHQGRSAIRKVNTDGPDRDVGAVFSALPSTKCGGSRPTSPRPVDGFEGHPFKVSSDGTGYDRVV